MNEFYQPWRAEVVVTFNLSASLNAKNMRFQNRKGFKSQIEHLLAVCPWVKYWEFLNLICFYGTVRIIRPMRQCYCISQINVCGYIMKPVMSLTHILFKFHRDSIHPLCHLPPPHFCLPSLCWLSLHQAPCFSFIWTQTSTPLSNCWFLSPVFCMITKNEFHIA